MPLPGRSSQGGPAFDLSGREAAGLRFPGQDRAGARHGLRAGRRGPSRLGKVKGQSQRLFRPQGSAPHRPRQAEQVGGEDLLFRRAGGGQHHAGGDPRVGGGQVSGDVAALAVPEQRDAIGIDLRGAPQQRHGLGQVRGGVGGGDLAKVPLRRARPALVEAQGRQAPAAELVGPDGERLMAGRRLVAVDTAMPGGKDDGGMRRAARRQGQGPGQAGAIRGGKSDEPALIGRRSPRRLWPGGQGHRPRGAAFEPYGKGASRKAAFAGQRRPIGIGGQVQGDIEVWRQEGQAVAPMGQRQGDIAVFAGGQPRRAIGRGRFEAESQFRFDGAGVEGAAPGA